MKSINFCPIVLALLANFTSNAQVTLNADGPGGIGTYELISSVFSPSVPLGAIEAPDAIHPSFGRHIAEVFDTELNKNVFVFYSHVQSTPPDNEPVAGKTDRQRVEIKTYAPSPDNLKGTLGETVQYKWRFKVPVGFKPTTSFTHIHQVKAVDGDDDDPLFTLTLRKLSNGATRLELIYDKDAAAATIKYQTPNMSLFEGVWVEATETIAIGLQGTYSILIKKVSDGTVLMNYSNPNIQTIRPAYTSSTGTVYTANSFIRPKWGIYRSLTDIGNMRDEAMRFSDFSIQELTTTLATKDNPSAEIPIKFANPVTDKLELSDDILNNYNGIMIYDSNGKQVITHDTITSNINVSSLKPGIYIVKFKKENTISKGTKMIKK
ncbi:T9SS type A sorting domain-containing protein [Flavobacterium sp. LS1R49]|uniref:T9SS type A sorting domain-containing protein n=1 Tax=Flavobacterium shii TaxID=2987687 RepID=A0A9X2ZB35_9FLAO|nr:T9SS type A sorting domain-containing protein [Flavobacterium shii]MCV9927125.1 T9SS type A sorting domain-containing protein [Flavobacterium shii]